MQRFITSSVGASSQVTTNDWIGDRSNFVTMLVNGLGSGGTPVTIECMADDASSYTYDDTGTDCTQAG